jgi:phosphopantothenoylcysteine synthetase/decarboxylase
MDALAIGPAPGPIIYLMVSGATAAHRVRGLAPGLLACHASVIAIPTRAAARVISAWDLARIPGVRVVESHLDPLLRPRPPAAPVLFAPCTFNSLNKLAGGIADNLALSIAAEMIGRGQRVVVAVSVAEGLWAHPIARASAATLRGWGVTVIEPQDAGRGLTLAPDDALLAAVLGRL